MPRRPDSRARMRAPPVAVLTAAAMCLFLLRPGEGGSFDCPLPQHISPCACAERVHGLDVSCHDLDATQLREVVDVVGLTRQTIWSVHVERAGLSSLPKRLFDGLDVRNLILVQSNVSDLDSDLFLGSIQVESLDLGRNRLKRVPSRALSPLKGLAALSLDFNEIETLEAHVFGELVSLLWLSLYGNRIRLIDSRAFLGTESSLTRLDLGGNRLGQVPRYALQRLRCLRGLRMPDNGLQEVLPENLPPSLCDLDLSGNELRRLDPDTFSPLARLAALDLEDNRIEEVHEDAFRGLHDSLEWLKLGGNELRAVPHPALRNLSRLRQLDLRRNRIARIEPESFLAYGKSLKFLFLQKNSIRSIEEGSLDPLESVEWLYLHSNALTRLHRDIFSAVIDRLRVLDLHDNPYHCDCDILWFRDWLQTKGQNVANLPRETRCNETSAHAQKPIVKLTNSSFICSGVTDPCAQPATAIFLIFIILIFLMDR